MQVNEIIQLIEAVSKADIKNFSMQKGDFTLAMDKLKVKAGYTSVNAIGGPVTESSYVKVESEDSDKKEESAIQSCVSKTDLTSDTVISINSVENEASLVEIKSPIVGTFYRAPGPGQENYVNIGDNVKKGQTVCLIEAMKLMNDIESEFEGTVVEVLVENESMVEYNQPLFRIRKN